jgi:light-regulated signal transduction histidine kinase (bacteriophytochrome)
MKRIRALFQGSLGFSRRAREVLGFCKKFRVFQRVQGLKRSLGLTLILMKRIRALFQGSLGFSGRAREVLGFCREFRAFLRNRGFF